VQLGSYFYTRLCGQGFLSFPSCVFSKHKGPVSQSSDQRVFRLTYIFKFYSMSSLMANFIMKFFIVNFLSNFKVVKLEFEFELGDLEFMYATTKKIK
jgi:hypothetical protein